MQFKFFSLLFILNIHRIFGQNVTSRRFPKNFLFGVSSSAYQIEGAWEEDDKGESIWDNFLHSHPEYVADLTNGNIACDSYHNFIEDVQLLKNLGVNFYKFSISWSRLLPTGYPNQINNAGVKYYVRLISLLKLFDIEPYITLYHWDLPQTLQEIGGWPNPVLAEYFADYARLAFQLFGKHVKNWMTFHEPKEICQLGYGQGIHAPGRHSDGIGSYLCGHTILMAHAKAFHIYNNEFRASQTGRVSIVLDTNWFEPANSSSKNQEAAERLLQFNLGWFAHPIYHPLGNYPQVMLERIANRSHFEGFPRSRLPTFTEEEINFIRGSSHFFAINIYTTSLAEWKEEINIGDKPSWEFDTGVVIFQNNSWNSSASPGLKVVPWGARKLLNWIHQEYNQPEIVITENGFSDFGEIHDQNRINFIKEYLSNILEAILNDGVNVTGYAVWSLIDSFEWLSGYTEKFGLFHVNFDDPYKPRTIKSSAKYYQKLIRTKCLIEKCVN